MHIISLINAANMNTGSEGLLNASVYTIDNRGGVYYKIDRKTEKVWALYTI